MLVKNSWKKIKEIWCILWRPAPRMGVVDTLEMHMILPQSAGPLPGPWRIEITPYLREILEDFDDPTVRYIDLCFSAQSGKTMAMTGMLFYAAIQCPRNTVWMFPSTDMSKSYSKTRWSPMVEVSPKLKAMKPASRHMYGILEQHFTDFTLNYIGGNSATQLASRTAGLLFMDEVDKLPPSLTREGDPCSLLEERAKWYSDAKIVRSSTPTTEEGRIWNFYKEGSMHKCFIPCPKCKEFFTPEWEHVKWSKDEELSMKARSITARIQCPNSECCHKITDGEKKKALREYKWIQQNMEAESDHKSYHFNEILSPLTPLPKLVIKFLKALSAAKTGDVTKLQNFINSSLGEPWYDDFGSYKRTDTQIADMIDGRQRGEVPEDSVAITAGIDTQKDGFWYTIRSWNEHQGSALVDYGFVLSFDDIETTVLDQEFYKADGTRHFVDFAFIDAGGDKTAEVYAWCRGFNQNRIMPIFGRINCASPVKESAIEKGQGRTFSAFFRAIIDTGYFKDAITRRMKVSFGAIGAYYFNKDIKEDYYAQMTAEFKDARGRWDCPGKRDNHLWDCEVYSMAAAHHIKVWERVEDEEPDGSAPDGLTTKNNLGAW